MSSTTSLYNALKNVYPNKVYVGQFDQSANLRSADSSIMIELVTQIPSRNKDNAKRDEIAYRIHVVGTMQKEVDEKCNAIRNLLEPYTDEFIYLVIFDSIGTDYEEQAETYHKILSFTVLPNTDGLNQTTEYWEHYAEFRSGALELLNQNSYNYFPISWTFSSDGNKAIWECDHNIQNAVDNIQVFYLANNKNNEYFDDYTKVHVQSHKLEIIQEFNGDWKYDQKYLIRYKKGLTGSFD